MTAQAELFIEKRVILDMDRCIGCRSCSAACFYGHQGMPGISFGVIEEGTLPVICRQCDEPACVEACPVKALRREASGAVRRSPMLCTGCASCVHACPFGTISPELEDHLVAKCDLCEDRVLAGEAPRCVATCTSGALGFESAGSLKDKNVLLLGGRISGEHRFRRR